MTPAHLIIVLAAAFGLLLWSHRAQAQSREDIRDSLKKLHAADAPAAKMGAMCYEMVSPPSTMEYLCPLDGGKTTYTYKSSAYGEARDIVKMRGMASQLKDATKGISFSLDERGLCAQCTPNIRDEERGVTLVVNYADGKVVRTPKTTLEDLRYLLGFFKNGRSYTTFNDGEEPLKPHEGRLKELLGEK